MKPGTKACTKCGEIKDLGMFSKRTDRPNAYASHCKACKSRQTTQWGRDNPEKRQAQNQRAYWKDPEKSRARCRGRERTERMQASDREWREANRLKRRESDQRRRAAKNGVGSKSVDLAQILTSRDDCYLCGAPLGADRHADHVIPLSLGGAHCAANLLPTHGMCNLRKNARLLADVEWYDGPTDLGCRSVRLS